MNKPIIKQWIDALKSGEYQHVGHKLRCGDMYCAWGVACDLHAKAGLGKWNEETHTYYPHSAKDFTQYGTLAPPECVVEWVGISLPIASQIIFANNQYVEGSKERKYEAVVEMLEDLVAT